MGKIIKAREIKIPADLPEKMDKIAGHPAGDLRNILAEEGKLNELDFHLLAISLGKEIKRIMGADDLPRKPLSLERFSDMAWVMSIVYILGTPTFDDDGKIEIGVIDDISYMASVIESDYIEFRNGTKAPTPVFVKSVQTMTSEDALKEVYEDIFGKWSFKRSNMSAGQAYNVAKTLIKSSDDLMNREELWRLGEKIMKLKED